MAKYFCLMSLVRIMQKNVIGLGPVSAEKNVSFQSGVQIVGYGP